ncbi:MAG TPA: MCP four helix bundle domain-containing protein, partial [Azonexus sp.]|nr:MCP four helix bundle domain-containing protein [Azonexus sp.]
MSIARRLILLLAASLAALLVLTLVNLQQMNKVYQSANFANENVVPSLLVLDQALNEFAHVRVRVYRHVLNTDPKVMGDIEKKALEAAELVEKALKSYEALLANDEDRRLLDEEKRTFADYMAGTRQVLEASGRHQNDEALRLLTQNVSKAEHFNDALQAHMRYNEKIGRQAADEGAAVKQAATTTGIAVVIIALLVVGGLTLQIRRSIVSRLGEANRLAERVAGGDLTAGGAVIQGGDELGVLMRTMEKMR